MEMSKNEDDYHNLQFYRYEGLQHIRCKIISVGYM